MKSETINNSPARVSVRTVILSMAAMWLCHFVLTTIRGSIVGLEFEGNLLLSRTVVTLGGLAITFIMWLLLRLFDARPLWMKIVAALILSLPASVMIAQMNQMVFSPMQIEIAKKKGEESGLDIRRDEAGNIFIEVQSDRKNGKAVDYEKQDLPPQVVMAEEWGGWRAIVDIALGRYFLLLAWSAIYFAMLAVAQTQIAERREAAFRRQAKEAELRSLRYQVNPHFLFNSLNSLSALVMTGKAERAENMIQTLSNFYRHSLAGDVTSDVDLADEFALQQHYLEIEAVRFPDRLRSKIDLPDALARMRVPGMILQPLVENSVKYAVARLTRPVTIRIAAEVSVTMENEWLVLSVSDDGPGAKDIAEPGFGIGLVNVRDRIRARFGPEASITAGPTDTGFCTEIRIPLGKMAP